MSFLTIIRPKYLLKCYLTKKHKYKKCFSARLAASGAWETNLADVSLIGTRLEAAPRGKHLLCILSLLFESLYKEMVQNG